jgi:hypothetical protein
MHWTSKPRELLVCIALCRIGRRKACRLWSCDHVFDREPGWSSPMYTSYLWNGETAEGGGWGWEVGDGWVGGGGVGGIYRRFSKSVILTAFKP